VDNYLIKPFNQQSLKAKIDQVFDNRQTAAA
jgi:DNA-binding response OmpR family regulator